MEEHSSLMVKIVDAAFRFRIWLLAIFISVVSITVAVTFLTTRQYASTMQIVVRDAREKPLVVADKATPESSPDSSQELIESHAEAEFELLSADDIMQRAVMFRAKLVPGAPNPEPGSQEMAKEIRKMSGRLKITPVRKTPVIDVTYRDVTPEAAQQVLQEVQRADLEKHLKVLRPSGTSKVFSDLAHAYDERLASAERQLASFQIQNKFLSLSGEKDSLSKDHDATRSALLQEQTALATDLAQVAALHSALQKTPSRIPTTARETANSYSMQQVTGVLVDLVNKRTQMLTRYQPTDRLVTELDKQIADTDARLQKLRNDPTVEKDTDNNPVWLQTQEQLASANVAAAASMAKTRALAGQLTKIEDRMNQLGNITADNDHLERTVEALKENQKLYSDKLDSEMLEDELDRDKLGNIAVAMEPTYSRYPVSPKIPLNMALGFLTATALCGMFLFMIESNRGTFYTPSELTAGVGIRALATIPECTSMPFASDMTPMTEPAFITMPLNRRSNHGGDNDGHDGHRS